MQSAHVHAVHKRALWGNMLNMDYPHIAHMNLRAFHITHRQRWRYPAKRIHQLLYRIPFPRHVGGAVMTTVVSGERANLRFLQIAMRGW